MQKKLFCLGFEKVLDRIIMNISERSLLYLNESPSKPAIHQL